MTREKISGFAVATMGLLISAAFPAAALAASFSDVPASRSDYQAVEYLKSQNILSGYADGTFHPDAVISRAEVLKMIVGKQLSGATLAVSSPFADVPAGVWFLPYVERARVTGIISGPPEKSTFRPADPVLKAEFLKMFFVSEGVDTAASFSDLPDALSTDVQPSDWFFPQMRFALASSMTMVDANGHLNPASQLTRGNVANLLYRYAMYQNGRRTQALLSEAENEVSNLLAMIDQKQPEQAEFASARSLIAARGALLKNPDNATVKGAVKITEGFQLITRALRAGAENRLDDAIAEAKQAWDTAERARAFSPSLDSLATQMQVIAKGMADSARKLQ